MRAILFLGTPHRGADLAGIVDLALTVTFSSRDFVKQLNPNSDAIKSINRTLHTSSQLTKTGLLLRNREYPLDMGTAFHKTLFNL
jgi:hypothetical protein